MKLPALVLVAAAVFAFATASVAGTLDVTLTSSDGGPALHLSPDLVEVGGGVFIASASGTIEGRFAYSFSFTTNVDPSLSGSFTLTNLSTNGPAPLTFTVGASLSGLAPLAAPTRSGGGFSDFVYTNSANDPFTEFNTDLYFRALVDGVGIADLGSFGFTGDAGPGATTTESDQSFGDPIPSQVGGPLNGSIGVLFPGFSMLGFGDSVSTSFAITVVPEPAFVSLFALVFLVFVTRKFFQRERGVW